MHIDWWTLALQTINLLVLAWLLGRFLFRPIARIVKERQATVAQALDEARSVKEQAEAARREAQDEAARLAAERDHSLAMAAQEAGKEKDRLLAEARNEADKLVQAARQEIGRMREAEAAQNARQASELAVDIAARLFGRLPDEARTAGFIAGLESGLAALPEEARAEIGRDGTPVTLKSARPLSDAETQACRQAIAQGLGREAGIAVEVDPALIAGLEIETPHAVVSNSFRADLDRITRELVRDGEAGD